MKRKVTTYRYEKKVYTYNCAGYEGHECGLQIKRQKKLGDHQTARCHSCVVMYRRIYQSEYYTEHREEAQAYQKEYNEKNRKSLEAARKRAMTTNSTRTLHKRPAIKEAFSSSALMNLQPEKLERSINRILEGICDYSGSK